ncbi:MAG: DUF4139 domain-containing protein [Gemmatimonadales bacterium]
MNNAIRCGLLAAVMVPAALRAQTGPTAAATSVTLFNSGRVLVRRTLPINLLSGTSTYAVALGPVDLSSIAPLDAGVSLVRISADQAWSEEALLRRNVGHAFDLQQGDRSSRRATLLSVDPERWEWADGGVIFGRPGQVVWPKELVPAAQVADVTLQSDRARDGMRLMYQTRGGAWFASYRLFIGGAGRIEGVATLSAGTLDLRDAEVQLLAGNIGAAVPEPRGLPMAANRGSAYLAMAPGEVVASSEAVGEVHLYTLPRPVTFAAGLQIVEPLFVPVAARAERHLSLAGSLQYYGGLSQTPDEQDVPVDISYRLEHGTGTPFGDLPLPAGSIGVFELDRGGRVQLIGQGSIGHTAPGERLDIAAGTAFDVTARRVQTDFSTSRTGGVNGVPFRTVAMASYRVTLQNAKDSAVLVEVREDRGGEWSVMENSVPADRRSATRAVFPVTVPAKGIATLTYRVRVVW